MLNKYSKLELICSEDKVELWFRGKLVATFAVHDNPTPQLLAVLRNTEDFGIATEFPVRNHKLDIDLLVVERDLAGLTKHRTIASLEANRKTSEHFGGEDPDRIAERTRDNVLLALLDSIIDLPNQTSRETREETMRIANKFDVEKMRVAGVRANLTRGNYGNLDELVKNRRMTRIRRSRVDERH